MSPRLRVLTSGNVAPVAAVIAAGFLLALGVATIVFGTQFYTTQVVRDTTTQAQIVASSVSAALAFDDSKTAKEFVDALEANPAVQNVVIYDLAGRPFVSFSRSGSRVPPKFVPLQGPRFSGDRLGVEVPVLEDGRKLGFVYLELVIEPVGRRLPRYALIAVLVIMTALVVAVLGVSQRNLARANAELSLRAAELGKSNDSLQFQINQREKLEAALRQSQKMEAIGQLTGGIAHDFNNLLQIISASLDMMRRRSARWAIAADAQGEFDRLLGAATEGSKRAAALTLQLLAFSRRQPLAPKTVDVNKLVLGISSLIGRTLGETIAVETILGAGLWQVSTDPNQLESAILNLAVNSRDAMPGGGSLTIETANAYLDEAYVAGLADLKPGQYVVVAVTDTGLGMSPEVAAQVFEPFFTTKQPGQGTGLGLSQVYGFTKQSGGHIKIYSEVDHGTTVKLYLPRHVGLKEELPAPLQDRAAQAVEQGATILVVEDEESVRASSVEMLRELGYRILEAGDGKTALEILDAHDDVQLLFTDVVLAGSINGRQLADESRKRRPAIKVLYTTGYARNAIVHHGRLDPGVDLISKPFSYSALAVKLREVLQRSEAN
jgi:signal transduction histidine kinase